MHLQLGFLLLFLSMLVQWCYHETESAFWGRVIKTKVSISINLFLVDVRDIVVNYIGWFKSSNWKEYYILPNFYWAKKIANAITKINGCDGSFKPSLKNEKKKKRKGKMWKKNLYENLQNYVDFVIFTNILDSNVAISFNPLRKHKIFDIL